MKLTGHRFSDEYEKEKKKLKGERAKRTENTERKIAIAWKQASNPLGVPEPLSKPSHTKPFRRARIDNDLRLYWWVDENHVLVFHDIVDHKKAKRVYRDVSKKAK